MCKVMDVSYGLTLTMYGVPKLLEWLDRWPHLLSREETLQILNSVACAHYALMLLKDCACGQSLLEFGQTFSPYDLVANDRRIGNHVLRWIVQERQERAGCQSKVVQ